MQSRLMSALEAVSNLVLGFVISVAIMYYLMPLYGLEVSAQTSIEIVLCFTIASFFRSYLLRRFFNSIEKIKKSNSLL